MAIATGTAAVIGAGIAAAGSIGAAKIKSDAEKKALAAQSQANADVTALTREQAEEERRRYDQEWQDYLDRHAAWRARRDAATGPRYRRNTVPGAVQPNATGPRTVADLMGVNVRGLPQSATTALVPGAGGGSLWDFGGWEEMEDGLS